MTVYAQPGQEGAKVEFKARYENWIGGKWVPPTTGKYFENVTPITGKQFTEAAQGSAADIELALDAAHKAAPAWGKTSAAERALILHRIGDRMMENLEMLAVAETWDNGKAIRETLAADIPLSADHFRYFAGAIRAQEGGVSQIDDDTTGYHFHEPLGVVGQIIPWNFPILMAVWKLAPALAAGNCVVLKTPEQAPFTVARFAEIALEGGLPPGVLQVVFGVPAEVSQHLISSPIIRGVHFTGSIPVGKQLTALAAQGMKRTTMELGGHAPVLIFDDVDVDAVLDLAATSKFRNAGQVCVSPTRFYVQESIYDTFTKGFAERTSKVKVGNGLQSDTKMGPLANVRGLRPEVADQGVRVAGLAKPRRRSEGARRVRPAGLVGHREVTSALGR